MSGRTLDQETKNCNAKLVAGERNGYVYDSFKLKVWNLIEVVREFTSYEMSHWVANMDRWVRNRTYENTRPYKRKTIVMADLGATNFRYEHPLSTHVSCCTTPKSMS